MATIAALFSKAWLVLTLALTGVSSSLPAPVRALVPSATPAPQTSTASFPRLQQAWAREQTASGRLGKFFDNIEERIARGQALIDKARTNGREVAALQAALDAFGAAVKQARPVFESSKGIIASHPGFDDQGNVIDPAKAFQTVLQMRLKLTEIHGLILPPARALRQAIQAFRQANEPVATPTP